MKCPNCKDAILVMSQRQGVEIDYCPECRGVWLDRGELDKILEKESAMPCHRKLSGSQLTTMANKPIHKVIRKVTNVNRG